MRVIENPDDYLRLYKCIIMIRKVNVIIKIS